MPFEVPVSVCTMRTAIFDLAVQPFLVALGVNLARWLVTMRIGLRAHAWCQTWVAFEHFAMAVASGLILVETAVGDRTRFIPALGIAVCFCKLTSASNHKTADVVCAFAVLFFLQAVLRIRLINSALSWAAFACLVLLFVLAAVPQATWLALFFTPRWI